MNYENIMNYEVFNKISIEFIKRIRVSMYQEHYGNVNNYQALTLNNIFYETFFAFEKILFYPYPWVEGKVFHYFQFTENLLTVGILSLLGYLVHIRYHYISHENKKYILFVSSFFILYIILNGLVLYNSGTIARYKFPVVAAVIIVLHYLIYRDKKTHV